jgi:predicted dehydrogenase
MDSVEKLNIGIVGAAGRGASFKNPFDMHPKATIHAMCDINERGLLKAARDLGAREHYVNYEEMLSNSDIDAVVIGTPMQLHALQAIAALKKGLHVLCEVTAGVTIQECRELVQTANNSSAIYMMAENYTYMKTNVLIRELVTRGLFGKVYYAEGEYLHELKELNEITRWRRKWQTGIDGITYVTHSLGPILQWMPDDRVVRVSCAGSGHHYTDPRGDLYENQDTCVMLGKTAKNSLIKIRVDMLSNRPHAMTNYSLQGVNGCYESARNQLEPNKIWLKDHCPDMHTWIELESLSSAYLPDLWRNPPEAALNAGHGGGDYFEVMDFIDSIVNNSPPPIGIHEAMDMTLPGLISQQSILQENKWLDVPDSRLW